MDVSEQATVDRGRARRSDAVRNQRALLTAAAAVFVRSGVEAPIREIAAEAGIGIATLYRHFPTRADLVVAVYQHQVEKCAVAGPQLLATVGHPVGALSQWVDLFTDFLVTKHGLAAAMTSPDEGFQGLHDYFEERLVPVVADLLHAAEEAGEIVPGIGAYELMRGIGNLCINHDRDPRYDPRRMIHLLLIGLHRSHDDPAVGDFRST